MLEFLYFLICLTSLLWNIQKKRGGSIVQMPAIKISLFCTGSYLLKVEWNNETEKSNYS